jgi:hypothetical protein
LLSYDGYKLGVSYAPSVLGVSLSDHPVDLLLSGLLAHHLKHDFEFVGINEAATVLVKGREGLPTLVLLLLGKTHLFFFMVTAVVFFAPVVGHYFINLISL